MTFGAAKLRGPTRPRGWLIVAIVAPAIAVAGCGGDDESEPSQPTTEANGDASAPAPTDATEGTDATEHGAERPVALPLDDVDPCDLFTPSIEREFGLRREPMPGVDSLEQPTCQMLAGPPGGYLLTAARNEGMERFEGIPEELAEVRRLTIAELPAAELKDANLVSDCLIGVDVADGQYLGVFAGDIPEDGTQDEICEAAVEFSEAVIEELRARAEGG